LSHETPPAPSRAAFSLSEAAELAGCSLSFLYARLAAGDGPAIRKIGRRVFVPRQALDEWLSPPASKTNVQAA
jgi:excisionase family DNA binding protein